MKDVCKSKLEKLSSDFCSFAAALHAPHLKTLLVWLSAKHPPDVTVGMKWCWKFAACRSDFLLFRSSQVKSSPLCEPEHFLQVVLALPSSSNTTTTRPAARKRACVWKEAFVRPDDCESLYWQRKPGVKWCDAAERPPLWPRIKLRQERRPWQIPTAGRSGEFCMNSGVIQSVATRWLAFWVDSPPALSHSQGQSVSSQQSVSVLGFVWVEKVTSTLRDVLTHFHIYRRQNKEMVWSQRHQWRIISKCRES